MSVVPDLTDTDRQTDGHTGQQFTLAAHARRGLIRAVMQTRLTTMNKGMKILMGHVNECMHG